MLLVSGCSKDTKLLLDTSIDSNYTIDTYDGYLIIDSIDMNLGFYTNQDNPLNDVSKNIEFINTSIKDTYLLAGHSGIGKLAYFNDLRYVKLNDSIELVFKDKTIYYTVERIERVEKNGTISIKNEEKQIILTTCDQIVKGYQLVIVGKEITN